MVDIVISHEDGSGTVDKIHPRKNELIRPPLANLDELLLIISATDPLPNYLTVDKLLAVLAYAEIPVLIAVTKPDLEDAEGLAAIYRGAGYRVFVANNVTGEGAAPIAGAIAGRFCALAGNSGVGKSSLLNVIDPALALAVGGTSKKLGRGRHTTRHVEAFELENGALVADTPGFSSIDLIQMSGLTAEGLAPCFIEFAHVAGSCRFQDCRHMEERDCAVRAALEAGRIAESRYRSYRLLYDEIKGVKDWERR
jgi:ribosome biogenesis GTPase